MWKALFLKSLVVVRAIFLFPNERYLLCPSVLRLESPWACKKCVHVTKAWLVQNTEVTVTCSMLYPFKRTCEVEETIFCREGTAIIWDGTWSEPVYFSFIIYKGHLFYSRHLTFQSVMLILSWYYVTPKVRQKRLVSWRLSPVTSNVKYVIRPYFMPPVERTFVIRFQ